MRSIFKIIVACALLSWQPTIARSTETQQTNPSKSEKPKPQERSTDSDALDFSGTGRPGQQTAGESRGGCSSRGKPIRAMLPKSNSGKTVLGHPNFWVYFPEHKAQNAEVEFIVQDETRTDIWRSRSSLNSRYGYQSFSLPKTEAPLKIGRWYRWYVKLYCGDRLASSQYVQGWIGRVAPNPELQLELQQDRHPSHVTYANHRIWYEAIDDLLNAYQLNPQSVALERDWQNIIQAKGVSLFELPSLDSEQSTVNSQQ